VQPCAAANAGLRESGNGSTLDGNQSSQVPSNFDVEPVRGRAAPELSVVHDVRRCR
jgi:hypothetical protein